MHPKPSLALLVLLTLAAPTLAKNDVPTRELEGTFAAELVKTNTNRKLPAQVTLAVSSHGRVRIDLAGTSFRLARNGKELKGRFPKAATGLAAALGGESTKQEKETTLTLKILSADLLEGVIRGPKKERTTLRLRRVGAVTPELVEERARKLVVANAQTEDEATESRPFPGLEWGNAGLHAFLLEGKAGEMLLALARRWENEDAALQQLVVDPKTHIVIAVLGTDDEQVLWLMVMDKATGAGRIVAGGMNEADLTLGLDQETLDRVVPGLVIDEIGHNDILDRIAMREIDLTIEGFVTRHWGKGEAVRVFDTLEEALAEKPKGAWAAELEPKDDADEVRWARYALGRGGETKERVKVDLGSGEITKE